MKTNEVRQLEGMQVLVDQNNSPMKRTALSLAAENGHVKAVEVLLKAGTNDEARTTMDGPPVSWAA